MDKDGGYLSRKLILIVSALVLTTAMAFASCKYLGLQTIYSTFCSTIIGLTALYLGANSVAKHIILKNSKTSTDKEEQKQPVEQLPPESE
jgi:hypothetical protein